MKNAEKPAKPILKASKEQGNVVNHEYEGGLSKRERFAMAAMQGLLANSFYAEVWDSGARKIGDKIERPLASRSVDIADALLNELNQ